eukprot:3226650-Prymnesium_polylepis.1
MAVEARVAVAEVVHEQHDDVRLLRRRTWLREANARDEREQHGVTSRLRPWRLSLMTSGLSKMNTDVSVNTVLYPLNTSSESSKNSQCPHGGSRTVPTHLGKTIGHS